VLASASTLGAVEGPCGEYSYGFTGTRLINDGISTSAGPFAIDLPAGTYDIVMMSNDNHPTADYQPDQTQEQWFVRLDNGYQSPPTLDIPSDQERVTTTFTDVTIARATAISVHHLQEGSVNSVNVECVGFTTSVVAAPATTTTEPPAVVPPASVAPTTIAPATPATVAPPTTVAAVTTPPTTVAAVTTPPTTAAAVATTAAPTTTAAEAVPVEVEAKVETPELTELARTGQHSTLMFLIGVAFVLFGLFCLMVEHRSIGPVFNRA